MRKQLSRSEESFDWYFDLIWKLFMQVHGNSSGTGARQTRHKNEDCPPQSAEPTTLWVSVSPSLSAFDQPILRALSQRTSVAQWQYGQEMDESCCTERAVVLLHDYLKQRCQPIHLVAHGVSGAIALLYTRRYPERVRSLTLLAVAEQPAVTWHAHYYVQRQLLPCSQRCLLAQLATSLFRGQRPYPPEYLVGALAKDLAVSPLLHSLCHIDSLPQGGVDVPLFVCGSDSDAVVHPPALEEWRQWLKAGDRLWMCGDGGHFFHYFHAQQLSRQIQKFWQSTSVSVTKL